jgi:hypothetical protein
VEEDRHGIGINGSVINGMISAGRDRIFRVSRARRGKIYGLAHLKVRLLRNRWLRLLLLNQWLCLLRFSRLLLLRGRFGPSLTRRGPRFSRYLTIL